MMDGIILPQGVVQHRQQQERQEQQEHNGESVHRHPSDHTQRGNSARRDTSRRMAPSRKSEVNLLQKRKDVIGYAIEELGREITKLNESSGFETAFQALKAETMKYYQPSRCKVGRKHPELNRYKDVVPFDATRVVLHKCKPDYINASHIQNLLPGTPNFIATQGPTESSTRVFWEMVAQYNVGVIVMVTNTIENARIKCDQYWPDHNGSVTFEPEQGHPRTITVTHVQAHDGFTWSERVFSVAVDDQQPRRVVQYHFTDWPDYGSPESPHGFVQYVRTVMAMQQRAAQSVGTKDPPLTVHCSAGVGRTGTFIGTYAILASLHSMRRDKPIKWDLQDLVRKMRRQRVGMVQTAAQFEFMYKATLIATDQFIRAVDLRPENMGVTKREQSKAKLIRQPSRRVDPPSRKSSTREGGSIKKGTALRRPSRRARQRNRRETSWDELVQLLSEPPLAIPAILHECVSRGDIEESTVALFKVFASQGLLLPFVCKLAEWDIGLCHAEHLVFRKNSLATKLLTATLKTYGQGFLKRVLQPLVDRMLETPDMSYEINPAMIAKADNLGENRSNLKCLTESFFNSIMDSIDGMPLAVQVLCHGVARATTKKFPNCKPTAVGSCFFLRFVTPAVVSPKAHNIVDGQLPRNVQRGLILVSKVLQAVANSTRFSGFKEEYMECMNPFVNLASTRGIEFLNKLSAIPPVLDETTLGAFASFGINLRSSPGKPRDLSTLGRKRDGRVVPGVLENELKTLLKLLLKHRQHINEALAANNDTHTASRLGEVLDALGPPDDPSIPLPELWRPANLHNNLHQRRSLFSTPSSFALDGMEAVMQSTEYVDTGIRRAPIMHSSWRAFDKQYTPVPFTSSAVTAQPDWADPDITKEYAVLSFNTIDDSFGVDRRSHMGLYKIIDGMPRNPLRRTGICGRGVLGRWGPNHFQTTVVTRWRHLRGADGKQSRAFKNDLPVMEVLLKINNGELLLPNERRQVALELPPPLQEYFGFDGELELATSLQPDDVSSVQDMVTNAFEIYKDVPADERSTDNSWVELQALWMHCPDAVDLPSWVLEEHNYVWAPLYCRLDLDDSSLDLLQNVATTAKAYFSDQLPRLVRNIMQEIERRGLLTEGLYRVSGSQTRVLALKEQLMAGGVHAVEEADIPALSSLLKLLLKDMKPPLLTHKQYDDFIGCLDHSDEQARHEALSTALQQLPQDNYRLLDGLIRHLRKVACEEEANKMGIQNLSLVFGPSIMKSPHGIASDMSDHGQQILVAKALLELPPAVWTSNTNIRRRSTKLASGQSHMANKVKHMQEMALQGEAATSRVPASKPTTQQQQQQQQQSHTSKRVPPPTKPKPSARARLQPTANAGEQTEQTTQSSNQQRSPSLSPHLIPSENAQTTNGHRHSIRLGSFRDEATDTDGSNTVTPPAVSKRQGHVFTCTRLGNNVGSFTVDGDDDDGGGDDGDEEEEDPYASCEDLDDILESEGMTQQSMSTLGNPMADAGRLSPATVAAGASMRHIAAALDDADTDDDNGDGGVDEYGYESATTEEEEEGEDSSGAHEDDDIDTAAMLSSFSRLKASARKAKKRPQRIAVPEEQPWFRPTMERSDLVALKQDTTVGRFLVYPSRNDIGNYCVAVSTAPGKVWTGLLVLTPTTVQLEDTDESFESFQAWAKHYSSHALPCGVCLQGAEKDEEQKKEERGGQSQDFVKPTEHSAHAELLQDGVKREHQPTVTVSMSEPTTGATSATADTKTSGNTGGNHGEMSDRAKKDSLTPLAPQRNSANTLRPSLVSGGSAASRCYSPVEFTGTYNEQGGFYQDNFFENLSETSYATQEGDEGQQQSDWGHVDEDGYDEYGGYYDEYGGYYDADGGYTDAEGNYYEPGSWVPDTVLYLEGEVTWIIRGKRTGLKRRFKETKTKKWLFLQGEMVFLYELTDMQCENPVKTIVMDHTWTASRDKSRVTLKHNDTTELIIQLEDKGTAKEWLEAFQAAIVNAVAEMGEMQQEDEE